MRVVFGSLSSRFRMSFSSLVPNRHVVFGSRSGTVRGHLLVVFWFWVVFRVVFGSHFDVVFEFVLGSFLGWFWVVFRVGVGSFAGRFWVVFTVVRGSFGGRFRGTLSGRFRIVFGSSLGWWITHCLGRCRVVFWVIFGSFLGRFRVVFCRSRSGR